MTGYKSKRAAAQDKLDSREREALKLALDALEGFIPYLPLWDKNQCNRYDLATTAIKAALAQPAQEPVAWGVDWGKAGDIPCVSIIKRLPNGSIEVMAVEYAPYSYTAPAQRTWVGLTNDEVNNFAAGCHLGKSVQGAIYEAEAKLEKNNAA